MDNDPIRLGGVGKSCQIIESLFCHKVKEYRGRSSVEQLWVFGIVDPSYTLARGYMEIVPDRSAATLLPIIKRIFHTGIIIQSDEWAAHDQIYQKLGFIPYSVNHSLYFVESNTGIHTKNIESY
ncbi:hypothetical protein H311_00384 [Anncaliia algerae PRA109]|nr:hypothetical protein H311_00384 [Anncaliia algerae PRA109]